MYCSRSSFAHVKVQFRPQSGIFVHTFCALLSPSGPILGLDLHLQCAIFMSCTALAAVFAHQSAVSASEWNFVSCFLALLSPFGPILGLDFDSRNLPFGPQCPFLCTESAHQPFFGSVCHPILGHFCSWHDFEWIFQGTHQVEQPGLCRCFGQTAARRARSPLFEEGLC